MQIYNKVNDDIVQEACELTMKHYRDESFLQLVTQVPSFNHTPDSGSTISNKIRNSDLRIEVIPFKPLLPWSKVVGYAKGNQIFINTRKLNKGLEQRVDNIMHEALHILGYKHKGNQNNAYNRETVPYKVGKIFAEYITQKRSQV